MTKNYIIYKHNEDNAKKVTDIVRIKEYNPTKWLVNQHFQTFFINAIRTFPKPNMTFVVLL